MQPEKRPTQPKHLLDHSRWFGVMFSNLDAESNDPSLNFGGNFQKKPFDRWCTKELTILAKKETTQPKKSMERAPDRKS